MLFAIVIEGTVREMGETLTWKEKMHSVALVVMDVEPGGQAQQRLFLR